MPASQHNLLVNISMMIETSSCETLRRALWLGPTSCPSWNRKPQPRTRAGSPGSGGFASDACLKRESPSRKLCGRREILFAWGTHSHFNVRQLLSCILLRPPSVFGSHMPA